MKDKLLRRASVWISCAVVVGCLGYSTLVLSAKPAYADTVCEPEDCDYVWQTIGPAVCAPHGGVNDVFCPLDPSLPDSFSIFCNDGYNTHGDCSGF
jgi:hypothetical protein